MFESYVQAREAALCLCTDRRGVVSFEYVIVAACVIAAVVAAFGAGGTGPITDALSTAISTISAKVGAAV